MCDCGWDLYSAAGHAVISFSRPGYGATRVGSISPNAFAAQVGEVRKQLDIPAIAAAVGVSFGGMQAVHVAAEKALRVPRLILHSCAPSGLPYPDSRVEAIGGRILFSPPLQGLVWSLVRRLVRTDAGLRRVIARLSKLPVDDWWGDFDTTDRVALRELFRTMKSDSGFTNDLRQGLRSDAGARREAMLRVACPTLVTGSRHDGGVSFAHALDLAANIPNATLVELDSPSHIFWIGPGRDRLESLLRSFLGG